jgi:formate dehydrogenase major subunit
LLYLLNNEKFNREYTEAYTNASLIVREDYGFEDGLFTGYDADKRKYDKPAGTTSWMKRASPNAIPPYNTALRVEPAETTSPAIRRRW